jgi:hypothetical protein
MGVPMDAKLEDIFIGDRLVMNWNNQNPDAAKYPEKVDKSHRVNGKQVFYTDEEYARVAEVAGSVTRKLIEAESWNVDKPTEKDIERLTGLIAAGKSIAREGGSPSEIDKLANAYRIEKAVDHAARLIDLKPSKPTALEKSKGKTTEQKIADWNAIQSDAKTYLGKMDRDEVTKAFAAELRLKIKDPDLRREKLGILYRKMGWATR